MLIFSFPLALPSPSSPPFCIYLLPAEDGDYWRLLNPGTHIVTATAKGYSRVTKRVFLPHAMDKAGRVDFDLQKVWIFVFKAPLLTLVSFITSSPLTFMSCIQVPVEPDIDDHLFPTVDTWDRFDPYNQFERYSDPEVGERGTEREEKPWWWNYFSQSGISPPNWLLRNV